MKKTLLTALLFLLPALFLIHDGETEDGISALLNTIDLTSWDEWFRIQEGDGAILPSELLKQLAAAQIPNASGYNLHALTVRFGPALRQAMAETSLLLGLAVLGAALQGLSDTSAVGETAQTVFRIGVSAAVLVFSAAEIRTASATVSTAERTGELLLPPIVGFLALIGYENTALLLPASFALLSDLILHLIETCVVPLAVVGGVLLVLDAGGSGRLASIGKVLQRASKWILGTACSLYMAITAIRSAAAGNADSLLLRTTKFAAGSIPTIGSLLSESVDTVFQVMRFVRNALGLTGCIVLLTAALKPALSVFLARSVLRVSSLLSEPLCGKPYADLLRGMGDTLHILMLAELSALAMSLMMLMPIFGIGGA